MSAPLHRVRETARRRREREDVYRAAVLAAREAGHLEREIAEAAGVSQQAVSRLLRRLTVRE